MGDLLLEYERVSRRLPCPVCGKPDWCMVARDRSTAICARVYEGSERQVGEAGYLHRLQARTDRVTYYEPFHVRQEPRRDFGDAMGRLQLQATPEIVRDSAERLGVSVESLRKLGVGYHKLAAALAFPMYDDEGVCGIRLRRIDDGFKYAVTGSRNGVFLAAGEGDVVVIVEGPTDAAAAVTMGFPTVIGRPFCKGGKDVIAGMLAAWDAETVVIVADSDPVGVAGAEQLADLLCDRHDVYVIEPTGGAKDMRAWLQLGATRADVMEVAANVEKWRRQ